MSTNDEAQHLLHRRPRGRHPRRRDDLPRRAPRRHQAAASVLHAEARLPAGRQLPRLHGRGRGRARAGRELHPHADARHEGEDPDRPRQDRAPDGGRAAAHRSAEQAIAHDPDSELWKIVNRRRSRPAASRARDTPGAGPQPSGDGGQSRRLHPVQSLRPRLPRSAGQRRDRHGRPRPPRQDRVRLRRSDGRLDLRRLRRMRAGLPDRRADAGDAWSTRTTSIAGKPDRTVDSVCPYCGVGCQLTYQIKDDKIVAVTGKNGPANQNRLCVKGRFGFDYVHNPQRLLKPMIRKDGVPKVPHEFIDPSNPWTHFREATWEEALDRAAGGLKKIRDRDGSRRARRLRLGQGLERRGLSVPEAGAHRLRHQQRRPLHAALPRLVGVGAARRRRLGRRHRDLQRVQELRTSSSSSAPTRPRTIRSPRPSSSRPPSAAPSSSSWTRAARR